MKTRLAYGTDGLEIDLPSQGVTVINPRQDEPLADERAAVFHSLDHPIQAKPLRDWVRPDSRICIVFSDITRPAPNHKLIPWLLEYLQGVRQEQVVLLNGVGTHRPNTRAELVQMLGEDIVRDYLVVNHDCFDPSQLVELGQTSGGKPIWLNRHLVEADVRIITGFIEPHFFAGFSGGPKGIMPGVAGEATIMGNHCYHGINHPKAAFGITETNPIWEEMREVALKVGPSFLLNVTLDDHRHITGVFAGDLIAAHRAGTEFVRQTAMRPVEALFDVVITTNSGYPLDMNLYQGVKGMAAAARILKPGGVTILACECREGVPDGSPFEKILRRASTPDELRQQIADPQLKLLELWQVQVFEKIIRQSKVHLHSRLPEDVVKAMHLIPCEDISKLVRDLVKKGGSDLRIAVLPYGPLTIPTFLG